MCSNFTHLYASSPFSYTYIPHQMKTDESETLEEYCSRVGCLLLSPRGKNPKRILQYNQETELIEEVSTDGLVGVKSLAQNEKKLVSVFRKNAETQFAGLAQEKCVQGIVGQRNLRGLRSITADRLGVNPKIAALPLVQLIWLSLVAIYNFRYLSLLKQTSKKFFEYHFFFPVTQGMGYGTRQS